MGAAGDAKVRAARRTRWALGLALASGIAAAPAAAYGPGVHLRECLRTAALLSAEPGPLGKLADPALRPWLAVGCIAPDFRQTSAALAAIDTHSWKLGVHLVQAAQKPGAPAGALAFAVGHLTHHASDASESFLAAKLAASALLGAPDLIPGSADAGDGECELWVETLGEFANGDLQALVGLLEVMGLFGAASADWQGMISWYVAAANSWYGKPQADPAKVIAELEATLQKAKKATAGLSLEAIDNLLGVLQKNTPADNVLLLSKLPLGDSLAAFGISLSAGLDPVKWRPLSKLPAFASLPLWHASYAAPFADFGPRWSAAMVQSLGKFDADWPPSHSSPIMRAGARTSLAWGMPQGSFAPQAEVLADSLGFFDAAGKPLTQWTPASGPVTVQAKLLATHPVQTWVALRVHTDPGTVEGVDLGAMVTATAALLAVDPKDYFASAGRLTLATSFAVPAAVQSARGLVVALARGPSAQAALAAPPFLHGNWTLYQAHNLLDVYGPVYDPHHHSYAGWPAGLRLPGPSAPAQGSVLVRVLEAPAGNLVPSPQAALRAAPGGPVVRTLQGTPGGRLLADGLAPPAVWLEVSGAGQGLAGLGDDGWPVPLAAAVSVVAGEVSQAQVRAWVVPQVVEAHWPQDGGAAPTGPLQVRLAPLLHRGDQPMRLEFRLASSPGGAPVWPAAGKRHLVALGQQATDDADPAHLGYTLPVGPEVLTAPAAGPPPTARVQVRLVFGDAASVPLDKAWKVPVDPAAAGPWGEGAVAAPVPATPDADADAAPGPDTPASAPDTAGDTDGVSADGAAAPAAPHAGASHDSGCTARRTGGAGPWLGWAWGLALGAWLVRGRRRSAARADAHAP